MRNNTGKRKLPKTLRKRNFISTFRKLNPKVDPQVIDWYADIDMSLEYEEDWRTLAESYPKYKWYDPQWEKAKAESEIEALKIWQDEQERRKQEIIKALDAIKEPPESNDEYPDFELHLKKYNLTECPVCKGKHLETESMMCTKCERKILFEDFGFKIRFRDEKFIVFQGRKPVWSFGGKIKDRSLILLDVLNGTPYGRKGSIITRDVRDEIANKLNRSHKTVKELLDRLVEKEQMSSQGKPMIYELLYDVEEIEKNLFKLSPKQQISDFPTTKPEQPLKKELVVKAEIYTPKNELPSEQIFEKKKQLLHYENITGQEIGCTECRNDSAGEHAEYAVVIADMPNRRQRCLCQYHFDIIRGTYSDEFDWREKES